MTKRNTASKYIIESYFSKNRMVRNIPYHPIKVLRLRNNREGSCSQVPNLVLCKLKDL